MGGGDSSQFTVKGGQDVDRLRKTQDTLVKSILAVGAIIMAVLLISIFMQVIFRYVLRRPLSWSEELARFGFVWISMLGAAATIPKSLTQGIDLLLKKLPRTVQVISNVATRILMVLFSLILVAKGWELTTIVHLQTSAVMGIRMSWVYASIPVAAFLMVVILTLDSLINYNEITMRGS